MNEKEEFLTIVKICERAEKMNINKGDRFTMIMDLDNTNQSIGLKLNELLNACDIDFVHDITGIQSNINRETGKLENYFLPRYAKLH